LGKRRDVYIRLFVRIKTLKGRERIHNLFLLQKKKKKKPGGGEGMKAEENEHL